MSELSEWWWWVRAKRTSGQCQRTSELFLPYLLLSVTIKVSSILESKGFRSSFHNMYSIFFTASCALLTVRLKKNLLQLWPKNILFFAYYEYWFRHIRILSLSCVIFFNLHSSINTQSCIKVYLCSTFKLKNLRRPILKFKKMFYLFYYFF